MLSSYLFFGGIFNIRTDFRVGEFVGYSARLLCVTRRVFSSGKPFVSKVDACDLFYSASNGVCRPCRLFCRKRLDEESDGHKKKRQQNAEQRSHSTFAASTQYTYQQANQPAPTSVTNQTERKKIPTPHLCRKPAGPKLRSPRTHWFGHILSTSPKTRNLLPGNKSSRSICMHRVETRRLCRTTRPI